MKKMSTSLMQTGYAELEQKREQAWVDLMQAVQMRQIGNCIKYAIYLRRIQEAQDIKFSERE